MNGAWKVVGTSATARDGFFLDFKLHGHSPERWLPPTLTLLVLPCGWFYCSKWRSACSSILLPSSTIGPSFIQLVNYIYTLFKLYVETLDIYLPLLLLPSSPTLSTPQVAFSVYSSHSGNIHTSSIGRTTPHRQTVTDWLPQVERQPEVKSRRGWEKTLALSSNTTSLWVSLGRQRKRTLRSLLLNFYWPSLAGGCCIICSCRFGERISTLANMLAEPSL